MTSGGDALELAQRSIAQVAEYAKTCTLDPQGFVISRATPVDPYRIRPPKRSVWGNRVGLFGALFVAALLALSWPLWALGLALGSLAVFWLNRSADRAWDRGRLAWDTDRQHAAILAGDDAYGIHGRFPCPTIDPDAACAELAKDLNSLPCQDQERDARIMSAAAAVSARSSSCTATSQQR